MTRPLAVLRPEPGNALTAHRIAASGHRAVRLPLFAMRALDWTPPDAAAFDALMLTSANAVRLGGDRLGGLMSLPVFAIGEATAAAARAAGLSVAHVGDGDGTVLLEAAERAGVGRALFLAGRERTLDIGGPIARAIAIYAGEPLAIAMSALHQLVESVVLLHSTRAAERLAQLVDAAAIDRTTIRLAAISDTVAKAAGGDWAGHAIATRPTDDALIVAAIGLAD